jgi:hypothetical protein
LTLAATAAAALVLAVLVALVAAVVAAVVAAFTALVVAVWAKPVAAQNRPRAIANARTLVFIEIPSKGWMAVHNDLWSLHL